MLSPTPDMSAAPDAVKSSAPSGMVKKFVRRAQDKPVGVKLNRHDVLYKAAEALYERLWRLQER